METLPRGVWSSEGRTSARTHTRRWPPIEELLDRRQQGQRGTTSREEAPGLTDITSAVATWDCPCWALHGAPAPRSRSLPLDQRALPDLRLAGRASLRALQPVRQRRALVDMKRFGHLLESTFGIRTIQELLRHPHLTPTMIYTRVLNRGRLRCPQFRSMSRGAELSTISRIPATAPNAPDRCSSGAHTRNRVHPPAPGSIDTPRATLHALATNTQYRSSVECKIRHTRRADMTKITGSPTTKLVAASEVPSLLHAIRRAW